MKMNELVSEIGIKTDTQNKKLDDFSNDLFHMKNTFDQKMKEFAENANSALLNFNTQIQSISELKSELSREINDLKLQKSQTMKKLMENTNDEFVTHLERIQTDANRYNDLKDQFGAITGKIDVIQGELDKFVGVSKNIKKEDFELTKYANKILSMDKEKLELMAKVDNLERLIAKMRRDKR